MNCDWRREVRLECFDHAEYLPPAMFGEAAWDCLLALHADSRRELSLDRLARLASLSLQSLQRCLVALEREQMVSGELLGNGEVRAVLTADGRDLLELYLAATHGLQRRRGEWPRLGSPGASGRAAN